METNRPETGLFENEDDLDLPKITDGHKLHASPKFLLLLSHFFSAWGDRMWMFAVGLYLVELTPNSLRLTAIYGLSVSAMLVLFGSSIGRWVDANRRLKVIRVSLVLQNALVIVSALVILGILFRKPGHPLLLKLCEATIIVLGSFANLASQASTIAIEKDWVVVVSVGDKDLLADLNAKMRRIDLSCAILAPIAVGLIMTLGSNFAGIIFICGWNTISFFVEYYLLSLVYRAVPRLAIKMSALDKKDHFRGSIESIHEGDEFSKIMEEENLNLIDTSADSNCFKMACSKIRSFWDGWRVYFKQDVALAGTSLAFLYLTVLGFSSVTTGYVYTQKISGAVLSVCYGGGSLVGIIGTFLFPRIRKKAGLVKTGLISFWFQCSMLALCVASVWAPGSPSDLYSEHNHIWQQQTKSAKHLTEMSNRSGLAIHGKIIKSFPIMEANKTSPKPDEKFSYTSVSLFLTGLILSRAGLWMTDLTVTQLLQENVAEMERGIVSGTQGSFNAVLDMAHYVLTIGLPRPNQFGILTLISFAAVIFGYVTYILFFFLKAKDLHSKGRDMVSVSSLEWSRKRKANKDDPESKGLATLDDDEEEVIRGTLQVRHQDSETANIL
ncbi:solute carrier family 40 member 1-like isoform X2 [Rhopilema esculentum]|uniref:solute carrier family 40 member 1-like isoform X2 n=1 Tax=Rhopilema esculentum TaxID=499914 RepID=UPI0031E21EAF